LASGPAIAAEGIRLMRSGMTPRLHEMTGGEASRVSPREIAAAAAAGDGHLSGLIERVGGYLGIAIANLVNILHPDLIVLTGGVAAIGDPLLRAVREAVVQRVGMFPAEGVIIERSALGDRAGVLGGIALAARAGVV
jgi:glucokinase